MTSCLWLWRWRLAGANRELPPALISVALRCQDKGVNRHTPNPCAPPLPCYVPARSVTAFPPAPGNRAFLPPSLSPASSSCKLPYA
jgi:hypothetical protein